MPRRFNFSEVPVCHMLLDGHPHCRVCQRDAWLQKNVASDAAVPIIEQLGRQCQKVPFAFMSRDIDPRIVRYVFGKSDNKNKSESTQSETYFFYQHCTQMHPEEIRYSIESGPRAFLWNLLSGPWMKKEKNRLPGYKITWILHIASTMCDQ